MKAFKKKLALIILQTAGIIYASAGKCDAALISLPDYIVSKEFWQDSDGGWEDSQPCSESQTPPQSKEPETQPVYHTEATAYQTEAAPAQYVPQVNNQEGMHLPELEQQTASAAFIVNNSNIESTPETIESESNISELVKLRIMLYKAPFCALSWKYIHRGWGMIPVEKMKNKVISVYTDNISREFVGEFITDNNGIGEANLLSGYKYRLEIDDAGIKKFFSINLLDEGKLTDYSFYLYNNRIISYEDYVKMTKLLEPGFQRKKVQESQVMKETEEELTEPEAVTVQIQLEPQEILTEPQTQTLLTEPQTKTLLTEPVIAETVSTGTTEQNSSGIFDILIWFLGFLALVMALFIFLMILLFFF